MKSALIALVGGIGGFVAIKYLPFYMVILLVCVLFLGATLLRPLGFYRRLIRRREANLASQRPGMTESEFIAALMDAGADRDVAQWVWEEFEIHYGDRTTPNADDHLLHDLYLEAEDLEDSVAGFFEDHALPPPSPMAPEMTPSIEQTTLASFAFYLTQRRYWLTNKKRALA